MLFKKNRFKNSCIIILAIIITWQWGQAIMIYSKAHLAKWMIAHAWEQTLTTGNNIKPWPWADTWPVAKILFPNQQSYYVLAGGAGNSLAFGPGHLSSTPLPGSKGVSVIGGHRDTHFSLLKDIPKKETIKIQTKQGQWKQYQINKHWIADSNKEPLLIDHTTNGIYLITCYPFNALNPRGPQRFIVSAEEII
ncbi:MAG: class GN sortase [Cellvibrionaceae bacterium]